MARHKETDHYCAIKQLNKADLVKNQKTQSVMREKDMLKQLKGKPFIIMMEQTFMDKEHLYFVFEHCKFGTLSKLITESGSLPHDLAVFYSASILEGLNQCFNLKIMHRDLKPENILIDE